MGYKVGDRVGALSHTESGVAFLFGFGTYQGDVVPPPGVKFMGLELASFGKPNPKIVLDNGQVVWGCECWWGPEDAMKKKIEGMKTVTVNIEDSRAAAGVSVAEASGPNEDEDDDEDDNYAPDEGDEPEDDDFEDDDDGDALDASYEKKAGEPGFSPRSTD